jgi:hypothetical protein
VVAVEMDPTLWIILRGNFLAFRHSP